MVRLTVRRLTFMIPLLIVVTFMTFMMAYLTNEDPVVTILHTQGTPNITQDLVAETREEYGLNQPMFAQYKNWFVGVLQLRFGTSYTTGNPVSERMGLASMNTLKLALIFSVVVVVTSIVLGIVSVLASGRSTDCAIRSITFLLTALPSYWVASILVVYVSVKLNLLSASGFADPESYTLSVFVITITYIGVYFRNIRRSMFERLNEDYVLYLKVGGIPRLTMLLHVLCNALQIATSIFCISIPMTMGGLVAIESVFAWLGLGPSSVKVITEHGFPVVQVYVLIIVVLLILFSTLTDIINAILNPRSRETMK